MDAAQLAKTMQKDSDLPGQAVTSEKIKLPTDDLSTPYPIDIAASTKKQSPVKEESKGTTDTSTITIPDAVDIAIGQEPAKTTTPVSVVVKPVEGKKTLEVTTPANVEITPTSAEKPQPIIQSSPKTIEVTPDNKRTIQQKLQIPAQVVGGNTPINLTINVNLNEPVSVHHIKETPTTHTTNFTIQQSAPAIPQMEGVKEPVQHSSVYPARHHSFRS